MIEWITRGLYWHYYKGDRLPLDIEMRLAQMRNGPWLSPFISDMNRVTIADGQFCCAYDRMIDSPMGLSVSPPSYWDGDDG
jgi:hypothetical protein